MADWNHNGSYDPQDAFLDAETFAESENEAPSSLPRFLDGLLTALFWLFLFVLVVLFC